MIRLKNALLICGISVFAVAGISLVRVIAAQAPWEQSWPANYSPGDQVMTANQAQAAPAPTPSPIPSSSKDAEPAASSPVVSAVSPSTSSQSSTPVKPDVSSASPPASSNEASSVQSVFPQPATPKPGIATPGYPNSPAYWCRPMNPDFRPPYSWYSGGNSGPGVFQ